MDFEWWPQTASPVTSPGFFSVYTLPPNQRSVESPKADQRAKNRYLPERRIELILRKSRSLSTDSSQ